MAKEKKRRMGRREDDPFHQVLKLKQCVMMQTVGSVSCVWVVAVNVHVVGF